MQARVTGITVDCAEPEALALFWSRLLQRPLTTEMTGPGWATVGSRLDPQPRLTFQRVPEPRRGKVRIHLDVTVRDIDAAHRWIVDHGGSATGTRFEYPEGIVAVMRDPEGNEFCIVHPVEDAPVDEGDIP